MVDLRFYQLGRQRLEQALPSLIQRIRGRGYRLLVRLGSAERVEAMSRHLWTFSRDSFLAHGYLNDGDGSRQPVWLTHGDDAPNNAEVLIMADGAWDGRLERFQIACALFDGNDPDQRKTAERLWQRAQAEGLGATYWQQSDEGGWKQRK